MATSGTNFQAGIDAGTRHVLVWMHMLGHPCWSGPRCADELLLLLLLLLPLLLLQRSHTKTFILLSPCRWCTADGL